MTEFQADKVSETVKRVHLKGFDDFKKFVETIKSDEPPVYFYFSGAKLPDGKSWCPDCNAAEPVVDNYLSKLETAITFVYVDVGDRPEWKDPQSPFRTDKRTRLMVIPTIIKWKSIQRLEGEQCYKKELLEIMFDPEED